MPQNGFQGRFSFRSRRSTPPPCLTMNPGEWSFTVEAESARLRRRNGVSLPVRSTLLTWVAVWQPGKLQGCP